MAKKTDLRVKKTLLAIGSAFLDLLDEKPFEKIQINDIAERAMINRGTFYLHYRDKYDLLDKTQDYLIREISRLADELTREEILDAQHHGKPMPHVLQLVEYVHAHPGLFRLLADQQMDTSFYRKCVECASVKIEDLFPELRHNRIQARYGQSILTAIFKSVINQWIFDGMEETKESIALLITNAAYQCEKNMLQLMK